MKRLFRFACTVFAAAVLSMGFTAAAANDIVDTSNTSHGYVTVNYTSSAKLKVGIQYNGGTTVYRDCPSGKDASFSLDQGDGKYTVTLYRNVSGSSYEEVSSKTMNVTVKDRFAPYLVSTSDIQFSKGDGDNVTFSLRVAPGDMGRVIGRHGRIAKEIRTLMKAAGNRENKRVTVDILD